MTYSTKSEFDSNSGFNLKAGEYLILADQSDDHHGPRSRLRAPKSSDGHRNTVRLLVVNFHVCSSDLCSKQYYVMKAGLELANPICDSMQIKN